MLQYGREINVSFTSNLYVFTIRNTIREGFRCLLDNVIYCTTPHPLISYNFILKSYAFVTIFSRFVPTHGELQFSQFLLSI